MTLRETFITLIWLIAWGYGLYIAWFIGRLVRDAAIQQGRRGDHGAANCERETLVFQTERRDA
ncbi:MAG: hypothetical protein ABFR95_09215 [Actinomycetota bacterium]